MKWTLFFLSFFASLAFACPGGDCGNKKCVHHDKAASVEKTDDHHHATATGPAPTDHDHNGDKFMVKPEGRPASSAKLTLPAKPSSAAKVSN